MHEDLFDGGDRGGQREARRRGGGEKRTTEEVNRDVKGEVEETLMENDPSRQRRSAGSFLTLLGPL